MYYRLFIFCFSRLLPEPFEVGFETFLPLKFERKLADNKTSTSKMVKL